MNNPELGQLEPVRLRKIWKFEDRDFTPWLANEENLALLGKVLGLDLELASSEVGVGPFRADIVCTDNLTGNLVLIENQLEWTDHTHLGQLLTYAAGLDAVTIVWVAAHFTDQHRAALDWLNQVTNEEVNFFGLKIELWQINGSVAAPRFNAVSKPNEWTRTVSRGRAPGGLTEVQQFQLQYWMAFKEHLEETNSFLRAGKPQSQFSQRVACPISYCHLEPYIIVDTNDVGVSIVLDGEAAKTRFELLLNSKEEIEQAFGNPLQWRGLPGKLRSTIDYSTKSFKVRKADQWPKQHEWIKEKLEQFHQIFIPRIKELDSADYVEDEKDT